MYKYKNKDKIEELNNIKKIVQRENLNLSVISYGGSCSNQLIHILQHNNYKIRSSISDSLLCHCPHYIDIGIPIIYLYDNPIKAFLSMKRRGFDEINQKGFEGDALLEGFAEFIRNIMVSNKIRNIRTKKTTKKSKIKI